MQNSKPPFHI